MRNYSIDENTRVTVVFDNVKVPVDSIISAKKVEVVNTEQLLLEQILKTLLEKSEEEQMPNTANVVPEGEATANDLNPEETQNSYSENAQTIDEEADAVGENTNSAP